MNEYYLKSPGECGRRRVRFDDFRPKCIKNVKNHEKMKEKLKKKAKGKILLIILGKFKRE